MRCVRSPAEFFADGTCPGGFSLPRWFRRSHVHHSGAEKLQVESAARFDHSGPSYPAGD